MATQKREGIHVIGVGRVLAVADTLKISLGVVTEGRELQTVQRQNADLMSNVIQTLLKLGIKQQDIKTSEYRIDPQYHYEDGKQIFIGYRVTNMIEIKSNDITQAGFIVDSAVNHGANVINQIQFTVEKEEAYYQQALLLASRDALGKAGTLARSFGLPFYPTPYLIVEEAFDVVRPFPFALSAVKAESQTPIEPGTLTIEARIKVYFPLSGY